MYLKPIFALDVLPWLSSGLAKKIRKLNQRIAEHESAKLALFHSPDAAAPTLDVARLDFKQLEQVTERARPFELAQQDLILRREWTAADDELQAEMRSELEARGKNLAKVHDDIVGRLISIGYQPRPVSPGHPHGYPGRGAWIPEMVQRHGEYLDAQQLRDELQAQLNDTSRRQRNDEESERLERELTLYANRIRGLPQQAA